MRDTSDNNTERDRERVMKKKNEEKFWRKANLNRLPEDIYLVPQLYCVQFDICSCASVGRACMYVCICVFVWRNDVFIPFEQITFVWNMAHKIHLYTHSFNFFSYCLFFFFSLTRSLSCFSTRSFVRLHFFRSLIFSRATLFALSHLIRFFSFHFIFQGNTD